MMGNKSRGKVEMWKGRENGEQSGRFPTEVMEKR